MDDVRVALGCMALFLLAVVVAHELAETFKRGK
jgi:hypothetical protein